MNNHSQILVVGRDQMLLQTRRLILGTYFEVEAAGRVSEAGSILSKKDFELIILCDTLSEGDRKQIVEFVRDKKPHPQFFSLIGPGNHGVDPAVGRALACPGGPLQLLRECADALGFNLRTKHKMLA